MRHRDQTTTLRVYTKVMEHSREGVAERLDQALGFEGLDANEVANEVANAEPADLDARGFRPTEGTRAAGFEPATSGSGGQRSIH